jgi:hypothetical protein
VDIPNHINHVLEHFESGKATTFRGTRLPQASSSFQIGVMHTSPQITIANAYANGDTNNSTGIGQVGNDYQLGFIHAYEVPTSIKCYKNFEYEDIQNGRRSESHNTLETLKDKLKPLSQECKESFFLDSERIPSENMKKWFNSMQEHYEVVIDEKTPAKATYLKYKQGLLKINLDSPKWDKILTRYQEANLRDLYEIRPLEMILKYTKNVSTYDNIESQKTLAQFQNLAQQLLDENKKLPWEANSLKDVSLDNSEGSYMKSHPYIAKSQCVGSAMEQKQIYYSEKVSQILDIGEKIQQQDFEKAQELMDAMNYSVKDTLKNSISLMRKKLNSESTLLATSKSFSM